MEASLKKILEILGGYEHFKSKDYPSRRLVSVEVPELNYNQMEQISMVSNFKSLEISLETGTVCIEVYKRPNNKRKREDSYFGKEIEFNFECKEEDRPLINKILSAFASMHRDLTKFESHVLKREDGYEVTLTSLDDVLWKHVKKVVESYKSFLRDLTFDFSGKKMLFCLETSPKSNI